MGSVIDDVDYYALLGVSPDATVQQIRTAFRKGSIKVHPDRNPDNPQAAQLFHELTVASQILLDPAKRASFDALHAARKAKAARYAQLDSKRKQMAQDLEQAELDYKKRRTEERQELNQVEKLKEQGRLMRERKLQQQQQQQHSVSSATATSDNPESELDKLKAQGRNLKSQRAGGGLAPTFSSPLVQDLGPLDTTLKLRWPKSRALTTPASLEHFIQQLLAAAAAAYRTATAANNGTQPPSLPDSGIDVILGQGDKIPKGRASVKFKTLDAALRLVRACDDYSCGGGGGGGESPSSSSSSLFDGVQASWASGHEPAVLQQRRHVREQMGFHPEHDDHDDAPSSNGDGNGRQGPEARDMDARTTTTTTATGDERPLGATSTSNADDEARAVKKRAEERARIEEEMRRQDEQEELQEAEARWQQQQQQV